MAKEWIKDKVDIVLNKPLSGPLSSIAKKLQEADMRVDKLITSINKNKDILMTDLALLQKNVLSLSESLKNAESQGNVNEFWQDVDSKKEKISNTYDKEMYPYLQNVNSLCGRFLQVTKDLQRAVVDIEKMKPMKEEADSSLRVVEAKGPADRAALIKEIDVIILLFNKIKTEYFQSPQKLLKGVNSLLTQLQRWWRNITKEKNKAQVNFIKKYFGEGQQTAPNGYLDLGNKYYLTTILANLHQVKEGLLSVDIETKEVVQQEGNLPNLISISLRQLKRAQRKYRQQILNSITGLIGKNNA